MLAEVDAAEGMQRAALRLDADQAQTDLQPPSQYLKDFFDCRRAVVARSGKCVSHGDARRGARRWRPCSAFTQFRQMYALLAAMIRHELDREALLPRRTPQA
jgi:hypothetical protein